MNRRTPRRLLLASLALSLGALFTSSPGCGSNFAAISKVDALRVLAVAPDKSYAAPGDTVTFTITEDDGLATAADAGSRPVTITWLGGCYDPEGDLYYRCYEQLASMFEGGNLQTALASGLIGVGPTFQLKLPTDIVTRRPKPTDGSPYYGVAYVFFAACAGTLGPAPTSSTGAAGSFPIGCFDDSGNQLGADSFVPGYTQIFVFDDGRMNQNPTVNALTIDGTPIPEDSSEAPPLELCDVTEEDRREPAGCTKSDPFSTCKAYEVDVEVPTDVAEDDPGAIDADGKLLKEAVWVDYFADQGDFDHDVMLVSDPSTGITKDHSVKWIGPTSAGTVKLWAVVHDSRGGQTVLERSLTVK